MEWSGRLDLNQRPLRPERSALPNCATPRLWVAKNADFQEVGKAKCAGLSAVSLIMVMREGRASARPYKGRRVNEKT